MIKCLENKYELEMDEKDKDHLLQVASIKKSQEAVYKTLVRVNKERFKTTKDRFINTQVDLIKRNQKLRIKRLVKRVVEKFKENVQEKNLAKIFSDRSDGDEIRIKISSVTHEDRKCSSPILFSERSQDSKQTNSPVYSLVVINSPKTMTGRKSRPISRSSFEEAITAEYLDMDNIAYKEQYDDDEIEQMENVKEQNQTQRNKYILEGNSSTPTKRTIVVTLPNLSSEASKKTRRHSDKTYVRKPPKNKNQYCSEGPLDVENVARADRKTAYYRRTKSGRLVPCESSAASYKMDEKGSRKIRLSDLPSLKVTLDQIDGGTFSAIFQNNSANMMNRVEDFINNSIKHNALLTMANQQNVPEVKKEENEKVKQRKIAHKNQLLDSSGKTAIKSIPTVRAEVNDADKLSVIGTNPKKEASEGRVSALSVNSTPSSLGSLSRRNRMSVVVMNRKRAKAQQERFPKLQEHANENKQALTKEEQEAMFLDNRIDLSVKLETKDKRNRVKSEYVPREQQKRKVEKSHLPPDENTKNTAAYLKSSAGSKEAKDGSISERSKKISESKTPKDIKKPGNMSDFIFRIFLKQNKFSKLPSYMDPNCIEALRQYKRNFSPKDSIANRLARQTCWQVKPFSVHEEFRAMTRLSSVTPSAF